MAQWLARREWLSKDGFFNGYYDNSSRRVEGRSKAGIRMFLASQVFAIMSGIASEEQARRTWRSICRYLKDPVHKGFRLNTDMKRPQMNLGRAYGFAYGEKENGAFFSHMNVMLANALYSRMFIREGKEVMDSLYRMASSETACIPPVLPVIFQQPGQRPLSIFNRVSKLVYTHFYWPGSWHQFQYGMAHTAAKTDAH